MVPVRDRSQFGAATKAKIIREIVVREREPSIIPVQAQPPTDCSVAENHYWDRQRN